MTVSGTPAPIQPFLATTMPKGIVEHAMQVDGKKLSIYGNTTKLLWYFKGITPAPVANAADRMLQVKETRVKRFPGDAGYVRKAHQRRYTPDTGNKMGATPGKNFWCEVPNIVDGKVVSRSIRQFTYTGSKMSLLIYAQANAARDFILRWETGRWETIEAAPTGGT